MAEGIGFAQRYPFSAAAKSALGDMQLGERIVELAVERIRKALKGDKSVRMLIHEADKKEDIASFAAARMILAVLRNSFITNSFAISESKKAGDLLESEDRRTVDAVASEFGIRTEGEGNSLTVAPADIPSLPHPEATL